MSTCPATGEQPGNFGQAFTHLILTAIAVTFDDAPNRGLAPTQFKLANVA
jgi:hypothetical protein